MAQCNRKDCQNEGAWRPVLYLQPPKPLPEPMPIVLSLCVCDEHRDPDPQLYLNDAGWDKLMQAFDEAGLERPERTVTEVTFLAAANVLPTPTPTQ